MERKAPSQIKADTIKRGMMLWHKETGAFTVLTVSFEWNAPSYITNNITVKTRGGVCLFFKEDDLLDFFGYAEEI